MSSRTLSLAAATLITVNIMVGSGIFINSVLLAQFAGPGSALTYLLVGLLILPLMISFTYLAHIHQGGSLYSYGVLHAQNNSKLASYVAFSSIWGYSMTKLASCAVALHVCATLLASIIPVLSVVPLVVVDLCLLMVFSVLNSLHVHVGKSMQSVFTLGKMLPIGTVLVVGMGHLHRGLFAETISAPFSGIFAGVPFVLYAFMGFEAATGLNRRLADPERNGWRVIAYAFAIGVVVTTLFQWLICANVPQLAQLNSYREVFPALLTSWNIQGPLRTLMVCLLQGGIAASAAGVAFGILYANAGNLYEMAERNLLPAGIKWHMVERGAIWYEAVIVVLYLTMGSYSLPTLQQLAALGATWTFLLSTTALLRGSGLSAELFARRATLYKPGLVAFLGIMSCLVLLSAACYNFFFVSPLPWILFVAVQLLGAVLYNLVY